MLDVIIVDDEPKVIQLICHLVDWSSFDMQIAATACDGEEALELISKYHPAVVITDIRMPGLDGIELIDQVQKKDIHPSFVIISGYKEFQYAQKAVRLGVDDYLLKPLKKKDLTSILVKIQQKHLDSNQQAKEMNHLLNELNISRQKIKNNLLTDMLIRQFPINDTITASTLSAQYNCHLTGILYECITIHLYAGLPFQASLHEEEYGFVLPRLQEAIHSLLEPFCDELISIIHTEEIIILINYMPSNQQSIHNCLQKLKVNILNFKNIYPKMEIAIGLSPHFNEIRCLKENYQLAHQVLSKRFSMHSDLIFSADNIKNITTTISALNPNQHKELRESISFLDCTAFYNAICAIAERLMQPPINSDAVELTYFSIIDLFFYTLNSHGLVPSVEKNTFVHAFQCIYKISDLFDWLAETCIHIMQELADDQKNLEERPIRLAKKYITEHYAESFSLETVSSFVGFNPAYFSTLFKKNTGQNFLDYVKEIRITRAKELLQDTEYDLSEITRMVGYSDVKYFTKLFKEKTHLTPIEFRKLYG